MNVGMASIRFEACGWVSVVMSWVSSIVATDKRKSVHSSPVPVKSVMLIPIP